MTFLRQVQESTELGILFLRPARERDLHQWKYSPPQLQPELSQEKIYRVRSSTVRVEDRGGNRVTSDTALTPTTGAGGEDTTVPLGNYTGIPHTPDRTWRAMGD